MDRNTAYVCSFLQVFLVLLVIGEKRMLCCCWYNFAAGMLQRSSRVNDLNALLPYKKVWIHLPTHVHKYIEFILVKI